MAPTIMTKVKAITSLKEFEALRDSGKLIYIDFYTTWCGPCKVISPHFDSIADNHHKEGEVEFYKVDIDAVPALADALGIRSIPTFHAYKNGKEVDKPLVGANKGALSSLIQTGLKL